MPISNRTIRRTPPAALFTVLAWLAALAGVAALTACDAPPPDDATTDTRPEVAPDTVSDARPDTAPPGAGLDTAAAPGGETVGAVRVWLQRGEELVPVERPGVEATLRGALEALVAGPTAEERRRGLSSWFGEETAGVLREVDRLDEGPGVERVVVDFDSSLAERIPGAASSAGSEALLAALDSTVFQFPSVDAVEYRMGGSCDTFWEWLQRECVVVRR